MINIRNSQIVTYDNGNKNITVYFDFDDSLKKYYIVPIPHLVKATNSDVAAFSLTKYKSNKGGINGVCTFDVELYVPQDALNAVKDALQREGKGEYIQGQFDWVSVNTFFKYILNGEEEIINAVPSMYGQNRVSFVVLLKKDEDVTTFINAFHNGLGSVSPFSIQYDMTSLTKLVGIRASVGYNASIAIEWQRTYRTEKDTWGNTKTVLAEVKKNLKQSGAGSVLIDPVEPVSDETKARVQDWAWTTLEKMVSDSVAVANAAATSQDPVQSTGSFTQNYQENEVIEWSVNSSDNLPMFDNSTWNKVYHEVDLRQLVVNFNLIGSLVSDLKDGVKKVDITVFYPSVAPRTEELYPTTDKNNFTYQVPGNFNGDDFNPYYEYKYKIYFKDSKVHPYESESIKSDLTIVSITPALLGIQSIAFTATNVPFTTEIPKFISKAGVTVERLIIDFYFNRPEGVANKTEQKEIKSNDEVITFDSYYMLPIENSYVYKLTYIMSDRTQLVIDPVRNFGADNGNTVLINFPLQDITFSLYARKDGKELLEVVILDAEYIDTQNSKIKLFKSFEPWEVDFKSKTFITDPEKWNFRAIKNPDGAYYRLNGTLLYKDYEVDINDYFIQANQSSFTVFTDREQASLLIDWNKVNWGSVANVEITLFQTENGIISNDRILKVLHPNKLESLADPKEVNKQSYPLLFTESTSKPRLIYNVTRKPEDPKFEYWMGITYNQKDGTKLYLDEIKMDELLYTLPPNGNSPKAQVAFVTLDTNSNITLKKARREVTEKGQSTVIESEE